VDNSEDKEAGAPTGSQEFEVKGLSRRAFLDRMKALGVGFGAAYTFGVTNADAAAPSGGVARIRSKDDAVNTIIEEAEEEAGGPTRMADSAGEQPYSRGGGGYSRGDYSRGGYSRADYSRGDYRRGPDYRRVYPRGPFNRVYPRGPFNKGPYRRSTFTKYRRVTFNKYRRVTFNKGGYKRGGGGYRRGGHR
jgi:hypothetical protein